MRCPAVSTASAEISGKPTLSPEVKEPYREFWPCVLHLFASLCKDLITFQRKDLIIQKKIVDKLVEWCMTQQWAKEIKQQLRLSKQCLKGDYKVGAYFITMRCRCGSDVVDFLP